MLVLLNALPRTRFYFALQGYRLLLSDCFILGDDRLVLYALTRHTVTRTTQSSFWRVSCGDMSLCKGIRIRERRNISFPCVYHLHFFQTLSRTNPDQTSLRLKPHLLWWERCISTWEDLLLASSFSHWYLRSQQAKLLNLPWNYLLAL